MSAELGAIEFKGKWPKASLFLSKGGEEFRYQLLYNGMELVLRFRSVDRGEAERAAAMLRAFGVRARARREGNKWAVQVSTNALAAGNEELRRAVLEFAKALRGRGIIGEAYYRRLKAKFEIGMAPGALSVSYNTRDKSLEVKAQPQSEEAYSAAVERLLAAGLKEGEHFIARPPQSGGRGYIRLRAEGLAQLVRSAANSPEAARLLEEIRRGVELAAKRAGEGALRRYEEFVRKVLSVGAEEFKGIRQVALEDGIAKVELLGIEARVDEEGRLHILQRFRVDGVEAGCEVAFYREKGVVRGRIVAQSGDDRRHLLAYCKAVGIRPIKLRRSPSKWRFSRSALEALMRFKEVAEAIREWLLRRGEG
jgi:hypothetical protein